ncbi:MAG: hypothetical protein NTV54_15260 [Ignavibacteriales bacterium]|nr:hypothetical protein [Ignavibacteriales bacterium]
MSKFIFQIGLLAFFVSAVVFGLQEYPLFDVILRAFIVCVGVILTSAVAVFIFAWVGDKPAPPRPIEPPAETVHAAGGAQKMSTAAGAAFTESAKTE